MLTVGAIIDHVERFAPPALAADWDNVGLLLGERNAPVQRVMTCLTVTPESASEAVGASVASRVTLSNVIRAAIRRPIHSSGAYALVRGPQAIPLKVLQTPPHACGDADTPGRADRAARRARRDDSA